MLLQPQPLAQHFLQGIAHRVVVVAGDRFDLRARRAQAGFQRVGSVQYLAEGALPSGAAPPQPDGRPRGQHGEDEQGDGDGHVDAIRAWQGPQSDAAPHGGQIPSPGKHLGLTETAAVPNIPRLMSAEFPESRVPEVLDAWRMVAARRSFEGRLPLSSMPRLRDALCDDQGDVRFVVDFDRDALQVPYVELRIEAALPLVCQRSLQRFLYPVSTVQRLGLIAQGSGREEADEAALPPGYEALLVPEDGQLRPADVVEDELILALPVVPVAPGSEALEQEWPVPTQEAAKASPFAELARLKDAGPKKK